MAFTDVQKMLEDTLDSLGKKAFQPVPPMQAQQAPADPSQMAPQQGAPPMADPSQAGMQSGMDPSQAGMQPGVDPSQAGAPPQGPQGQDPIPVLVKYMEDITTAVENQQRELQELRTEIEHQKEMRDQREKLVKSKLPPS